MPPLPLLEVTGLSVRFDTDDGPVHAVDRLSFTLARGEVLGIVGESGCGKTVTCLSLLRLLPETAVISGRAVFDGVDLLALTTRELRNVRGREISFVFQEPSTSLNPVFTVGRQIGEVLRKHLGMSRRGMRQRVMIAMAIACDPKVLIADEPTTALDVTIQASILDLMREIRARLGTAIVLITHDLGVVADIADRVLVVYAGRKAEEATTADLFAKPQHPYTVALLGAIPRQSAGERRLREIPGRVPSLRELPAGCAFADRCPRADELCGQMPTLRTIEQGHLAACFHPGVAL
jgi:peptide/nickel transport system ATP-binding protein